MFVTKCFAMEDSSIREIKDLFSAIIDSENIFTLPDQMLFVSGTTVMKKAYFTTFTPQIQ